MNEDKARKLAEIIGGQYFNSGGGVFVVYVERTDGRVVAFSDEVIALYASVEEIGNDPINEIVLI